ncbi:MAG: methyl-accepting chemotaxis protein [Pseudomonadota bacterium]
MLPATRTTASAAIGSATCGTTVLILATVVSSTAVAAVIGAIATLLCGFITHLAIKQSLSGVLSTAESDASARIESAFDEGYALCENENAQAKTEVSIINLSVPVFKSNEHEKIVEVSKGLDRFLTTYRDQMDVHGTTIEFAERLWSNDQDSTDTDLISVGRRSIKLQRVPLGAETAVFVHDNTAAAAGRAIFDAKDSVFSMVVDDAGRIIKATQAFADLYRGSENSLEGTSIIDAALDSSKNAVARSIRMQSGSWLTSHETAQGQKHLLCSALADTGLPSGHTRIVAQDLSEAAPQFVSDSFRFNQIRQKLAIAYTDHQGMVTWNNSLFADCCGAREDGLSGSSIRSILGQAFVSTQSTEDYWNALTKDGGGCLIGRLKDDDDRKKDVIVQALKVDDSDQAKRAYIVLVSPAFESALDHPSHTKTEMGETEAAFLKQFASSLDRLARGDLEAEIKAPFPPDFEKICIRYNDAVKQLNRRIGGVQTKLLPLKKNAEIVASAAQEMAQRTEGQAATLEQSAASLEQLTGSVSESAKRTDEITKEINEAQESARDGGTVVREAVSAMGEISSSSNEISQIIGLIDDIAFQTNLLALNAGVEAARAGDAGRGFAVVASEVRALAQRSSDAANQIKRLISKSAQEVQAGVALVDKTGAVLEGIIASIDNINERVRDANASSTEQAQGVKEVSSAVSDLDQVTQQNAAMAEENIALGRELNDGISSVATLLEGFGSGMRQNVEHERTQQRTKKSVPVQKAMVRSRPRQQAPKNAPIVHEQQARISSVAASLSQASPLEDQFDDDWTEF